MKIRGRRECKACGTQWSYYDTGEVFCPSCGSHHSVGTGDARTLHTATTATLDLTPLRGSVDSEPIDRLADRANDRARAFTRGYGFIDAGRLQPLDDTYLATMELKHVAASLRRRLTVPDDEGWYFSTLFRADEGERPNAEAVPQSLRAIRGLAYANAVREYHADLRTYVQEHPDEAVEGVLARLATHIKRIRALEGDVPPREAETLVSAARALGRYLIEGDEGELALAEERLDSLG
ncbi:MAG: DUF7117 family protein [Halobacteriota archaeon]|uniref:DUF7117 family protein n=1 Tax=Natronomonas sp. TaxID=2184060 RepID=UPI003975AC48